MNTLEQHAQIFKALSEPVRLRILSLLLKQPSLCVCDIVNTLRLGQSLVSRHLNTLKQAQIVSAKRKGAWMHYQITENFKQKHPHLIEQLTHLAIQSNTLQEDLTNLQHRIEHHLNCQINTAEPKKPQPRNHSISP